MTTSLPIERISLSELIFDPENPNLGSDRGHTAILESIQRFGFVDAGILDRDRELIGGNQRTKAALEAGLENAIIIKADGKTPIYIQFDEYDLDSPDPEIRSRSRQLSYFLNRTAQVSLTWNPALITQHAEDGVDLDSLWLPEEMAELRSSLSATEIDPEFDFSDFQESDPGEVMYRVVIDSLGREQAEELQRSTPNARIEQYRA